LRRPRAQSPNARQCHPLSPLPFPAHHHQPRGLALLPVYSQLPRRRRPPRATRHHRLIRNRPALVSDLRPRLRATAPPSPRARRRHVASGRVVRDDQRPASVLVACGHEVRCEPEEEADHRPDLHSSSYVQGALSYSALITLAIGSRASPPSETSTPTP
jgi:hypothetical protein